MKSHKTHAKHILPGLHSPLTLLEGLSPALIGWMTIFGAWSAAVRTEGFIPAFVLRDFEQDGETITEEIVDALVAAGKWEREPRGIYIVDWELTQDTDHVEEQYHEELETPSYTSEDAEAVNASLSASEDDEAPEDHEDPESDSDDDLEPVEGDSDDEDESYTEEVVEIHSVEALEAILAEDSDEDDTPEREKLSELREGVLLTSEQEHVLKFADEAVNERKDREVARVTTKPKFEYSDAELNKGYDEFLEIMMLRPEAKRDCWDLFCDEVETFSIDEVLDAADDYAQRTGGKRRDSKRFHLRELPEVWLEEDGVGRYMDLLEKNGRKL